MPNQPREIAPNFSPHDPRSICNLILDEADKVGRRITNLALQKLLYFAHGLYLIETKGPLVTGYFEAWHYGPVHPVAYEAFKSAGNQLIGFRAIGRDLLTRSVRTLPECREERAVGLIRRIVSTYGQMSAGRLVDVSHAKGAPWDFVVNESRTGVVLGMRIPDDVIVSLFSRHKVSVGPEPKYGEPSEDYPFGRN